MAVVEREKNPEFAVTNNGFKPVSRVSEAVPNSFAGLKKEIDKAAEGQDESLKQMAKVWGGITVLILVFFISFVSYTLSQTDSRDTNLEEKILTGDKMESLRALKQHSLEYTSTTYNMVLGFVIVAMLIGFGGVLFYVFLSEHSKRQEVANKVRKVVDIQQANMFILSQDLSINKAVVGILKDEIIEHREKDIKNEKKMEQLKKEKAEKVAKLEATIREVETAAQEQRERITKLTADRDHLKEKIQGLEEGVRQYEIKIKEHSEKDEQNEKEIKKLEILKARKLAELEAANESLQSNLKNLTQAEMRERELKDEVRRKEQSNQELKEEVERKQANITTLRADVQRESSLKEKSQSMVRQLEADKKHLLTIQDQLSTDKRRLQTEKSQLSSDKDRLEMEKSQLSADQSRLETQTYHLSAERSQLKAEKEQLWSGNSELETENMRLECQAQRLTREKERAERDYTDFVSKPWYKRAIGK